MFEVHDVSLQLLLQHYVCCWLPCVPDMMDSCPSSTVCSLGHWVLSTNGTVLTKKGPGSIPCITSSNRGDVGQFPQIIRENFRVSEWLMVVSSTFVSVAIFIPCTLLADLFCSGGWGLLFGWFGFVTQTGLKLTILLLHLPQCWDYRYWPLCLAPFPCIPSWYTF